MSLEWSIKRLPLLASKDGSIDGAFPDEFPNITNIPNGHKHSKLSSAFFS